MIAAAEFVSTTEQLRHAVPGLAGLAGFVLLPTLGSWAQVLLGLLDWDRSGIARNRRLPGGLFLRASFLSVVLGFFVISLVRAAAELRDVQAEAPVLGASIRGLIIGGLIWSIYALGVSTLRKDARRRERERRIRTLH